MNKNKIGIIFMVSVLALAGIGISYAGFTDVITVFSSVNTATVDLVVEDYSGTDVWKVYGPNAPPGEIIEWHGFISDLDRPTQTSLENQYPGCTVLPVSSAWAFEGTCFDVEMDYDNLFPCIDFTADVMIHYKGSIPAHVTVTDLVWDASLFDFSPYATFEAFSYTKENGAWVKGELVTFPLQMHYCEYIGIEVTVHLEQDNALQGKSGAFSFNINAIQWNDECDDEPFDCDECIELVINGGFEYPVVTHSAKWDIYPDGTPNLGWNVEWVVTDNNPPANLELHVGVNNWAPYEGSQYAELDSDFDGPGGPINNEPASIKIYQDIPTVPGRLYRLSFAFSPRPATGATQNILNVGWDGLTVAVLNADGTGKTNTDWAVYSYELVASSDLTRISFSDGGTPNSMGTFLDAVSVRAICFS